MDTSFLPGYFSQATSWLSPWSKCVIIQSVQFSFSVLSDSLQLHDPQQARPPYPSPTPGIHPNPCPLSWWCHPIVSSSVVPLSSWPQPSQHQGLFKESVLCIRWPKDWSFTLNISPSNEHPGLISFRMDWLALLAVQGTLQESSPTPRFKSITALTLSFLYSPTLTSGYDCQRMFNRRIPASCFLFLINPLFLISPWHAAPRTEAMWWNTGMNLLQ